MGKYYLSHIIIGIFAYNFHTPYVTTTMREYNLSSIIIATFAYKF